MTAPAPWPKWVYDVVLELEHRHRNNIATDVTSLVEIIPPGLRTACRGILDYHALRVAEEQANLAAQHAPEPVTQVIPVVPLQQSPQAAAPTTDDDAGMPMDVHMIPANGASA